MEALPLSRILRKIVWNRLAVCMRRCTLRTQQGRQRILLGAGLILFLLCSVSVLHLPDPDDAVHAHQRVKLQRSSHGEPLTAGADAGIHGMAHGASLPEENSLPPPPPSPAVAAEGAADSSAASYAAELRRRANELNKEIARFNEKEVKAIKSQRLRKTAEQLDNELRQLKQVRESSFSIKGKAANPAPANQPQPQLQQALARERALGNATQPHAAAARLQSKLLAPLAPPQDLLSARRKLVRTQGASALDDSLVASAGQRVPTAQRALANDGRDPCQTPHPEFRIGMVLPWITEEGSTRRFPPWLPYFVATARSSAMLVDFLMIHEGPLAADELPVAARAPNVRFVDVGAGGIANLVAYGMGSRLHLPEVNVSALATRLRFMFAKWPRLVAEYKPAFGAVFASYLVNYSHWGYSDLDMVLGQLPRFIERSELLEHHIVTYSFGDADAIYLRGQWTVHQNLPNVNSIWMGCEHLGRGLMQEVYQKVVWVKKNEAAGRNTYHKRFLSAEGCYSHRAMHTKGIKIKVATKQFAGLELRERAHEVVYAIRGALWICQSSPIAGGDASDADVPPPNLAALRAASAPMCDAALNGAQTNMGEPRQIETNGDGCGAWMQPEHRVCAPDLQKRPRQTVLRRNGAFYAQGYEDLPSVLGEDGRCRQVAFFHMQEWKKRWEDGHSHVDPAASYTDFRLTQDGIQPLPE